MSSLTQGLSKKGTELPGFESTTSTTCFWDTVYSTYDFHSCFAVINSRLRNNVIITQTLVYFNAQY